MDAEIDAVRVAGTPNGPVPVVVLSVAGHRDVLPVFISFDQARSIVQGLDATDIGRPLTHDLLLDTMEELGGRVERVVVTDVRDDTYIADVHVAGPRDSVVVDARPSDALALAARTNVPIEVAEAVFESGRRDPGTFTDLDDVREVID